MPGTSVQISRRTALSLAAKYAAEVSDPPRPSSTDSPAALAAMNPWVMMTWPCACHRACSSASGAKSQVADRETRLQRRAGTRIRAQHLASIRRRRADSPERSGDDAPKAVASNSPKATIRARDRSSSTRLSASCAADCRSSTTNPSNSALGTIPRLFASSRCRLSICSRTAACVPASAAVNNDSRRSRDARTMRSCTTTPVCSDAALRARIDVGKVAPVVRRGTRWCRRTLSTTQAGFGCSTTLIATCEIQFQHRASALAVPP